MISIDIMTDRALFIFDMTKDDIEYLHKSEITRDSRHIGAEIAMSDFGGRKLNFPSGMKTSTEEWRRFEDDILKLRPKPNDDFIDIDYIHAWDWEIFHKIKADKYNFFQKTTRNTFDM